MKVIQAYRPSLPKSNNKRPVLFIMKLRVLQTTHSVKIRLPVVKDLLTNVEMFTPLHIHMILNQPLMAMQIVIINKVAMVMMLTCLDGLRLIPVRQTDCFPPLIQDFVGEVSVHNCPLVHASGILELY